MKPRNERRGTMRALARAVREALPRSQVGEIELQEAVLLGKPEASRVNFETLVQIARRPLWSDQRVAWQQVTGEGSVQPNSEAE